jgi:very-short-patch-repair endonuclease
MPDESSAASHRAQALRRRPGQSEMLVREKLRNRKLGEAKFRRQRPTGPYFLDLYCAELQLAVGIDGKVHESERARERDSRRDALLGSLLESVSFES